MGVQEITIQQYTCDRCNAQHAFPTLGTAHGAGWRTLTLSNPGYDLNPTAVLCPDCVEYATDLLFRKERRTT